MKIRIKYISPASLAAALAIIYFVIGTLVGILVLRHERMME
jgi:hypothetical protein